LYKRTIALGTSIHFTKDLRRSEPIRYDTRCYFNVRSKADISQLNLPHGTKRSLEVIAVDLGEGRRL